MTKKESKVEIKRIKKEIFIKDSKIKCRLSNNIKYFNYKLLKYFYLYKSSKNWISKIINYRKYAKYSRILNVQLNCKTDLKGFGFSHQNIVVNKEACIGEKLFCVGNNCIGGKNGKAPKIGNNVYLGYGSIILGDVEIADNTIIGAGAIITKSIKEKGLTVVGLNQIIRSK